MSLRFPAADSLWGPALCAAGLGSLAVAWWIHGVRGRPTIFPPRSDDDTRAPGTWERISVHLIAYGAWAAVFGATIWRGVPEGMIDVRLVGERNWPVWEPAEWIYLSVYFVPAAMPWLAGTRAALRRYALTLGWLLLISLPFFLLPLGSPPREFVPTSLAGRILAWETARADFAAVSLPSFHVFWGLLVAQLLATRGRGWAWVGGLWASAVAIACLATGAHALVDVALSGAIFPLVAAARSPLARKLQAAADRLFRSAITPAPSKAPSTSPPRP